MWFDVVRVIFSKRAVLSFIFFSIVFVQNSYSYNIKYTHCIDYSIVNSDQKTIDKHIKNCIRKNDKFSFFLIQYSRKYFDRLLRNNFLENVDNDKLMLISILNGIDAKFIENIATRGGEYFSYGEELLENNIMKMDRILRIYNINFLSTDCKNLINTDGCYEPVARYLNLPSKKFLKVRLLFW